VVAHVPRLILDLATVLGVAAVITLVFRRLKQPAVLGYMLAGLIVGPHVPGRAGRGAADVLGGAGI
jgi:CPA2 family monovalent cation:H+ antiporter-2